MLMITNAVVRFIESSVIPLPSLIFHRYSRLLAEKKKKKEVKDEQAVNRKSQFFLSSFLALWLVGS